MAQRQPARAVKLWRSRYGAGLIVSFGVVWLEIRLADAVGHGFRYGIGPVEIGVWW